MTPVEERLKRRIALTGPISVADYMAACVGDPDGYYARQEPFGASGDFVTAPEISQMFGEIVGAWLLDRWRADGSPDGVDLVELGPGRGTLMADILRVVRRDPRFIGASRVVMVESSQRLRKRQSEAIGGLHPRVSFADAPPAERPVYLVANEFFDALPIRQFVRQDGRWFERTVGVADDRLVFGLSPFPVPMTLDAPEGAVREMSAMGEAIARRIAETLKAHGRGAALIVDYGYAGAIGGETLQAVHRHDHAEVLDRPGEIDLSAHVDFEALARAAGEAGAHAHGPVEQGSFLVALGLIERAGQLGTGATAEVQDEIHAAVNRLAGVGPGEMGELFKAMALTASPDDSARLRAGALAGQRDEVVDDQHAQEEQAKEQHQRRQVEAAHAGQHVADRPQHRLRELVKHVADHRDELVARVHHVERVEPREDRRGNHDPRVHLDDREYQRKDRCHGSACIPSLGTGRHGRWRRSCRCRSPHWRRGCGGWAPPGAGPPLGRRPTPVRQAGGPGRGQLRSVAPVALATAATIASATPSMSLSVNVLSVGCSVASMATDLYPSSTPLPR